MLKTEEGQCNAVFACFGSAAQHAQHLEAALVECLLVYNKISKQQLTIQDIDALDQKLSKQTLETLLREFQKFVTIGSADVEKRLELALEERNFLMHHFFLRESTSLLNSKAEWKCCRN